MGDGHPVTNDVIIVLPGILGSVLERGGRLLWGASVSGLARFLATGGRELMLRGGAHDAEPGDGVVATRLLSIPALLPHLVKTDGYDGILECIRMRLRLDGRQLVPFPYDWRLSNRHSALQLAGAAERALAQWRDILRDQHGAAQRSLSGRGEPRLVLIAHSMGGLVARYYLEVLGGWRHTRRLITLGTPYQGAPNAARSLLGHRMGLWPLRADVTSLVRSFPSVYELLPTYPCVINGRTQQRHLLSEIRLPGLDCGQIAAAVRFHAQIREAISTRRVEGDSYATHAVVGIHQPTLTRLHGEEGKSIRFGDNDPRGDGTVPARSALPPEWDGEPRSAVHIATCHSRLHAEDRVFNHIEGLIAAYRWSQELGVGVPLGLRLPDFAPAGEYFPVGVTAEKDNTDLILMLEIRDLGDHLIRSIPMESLGSGRYATTVGPLTAGMYRATVVGRYGRPVEPVSDVLLVWATDLRP